MSVSGCVMWAELQDELSQTGLDVVVGVSAEDYPWPGEIDGKPFRMSVPPRNNDGGERDWLIVSLYGQDDEEKIVEYLNKYMDYPPFCKYKHKENNEATVTYEWNRKNPKQKLEKLTADEDVFDLKQFEAGFKKHEPSLDMSRIYSEFTPEDVAELEKELKEDPDAYYEFSKISKILPFIKKTMPRVGNDQSVFGLSIICLPRKYFDEEKVVRYGLEPLTKAGILTDVEVKKIVDWFKKTEPTWDSDDRKGFAKTFKIDGIKYKLMTDCCRGYRDLNLHIPLQS